MRTNSLVATALNRFAEFVRVRYARNWFAAVLSRSVAHHREDGVTVPFGVTLTLGDRSAKVAATHLSDPDTAHTEVAALLRRVADHLDPAVPGGAQGDNSTA